MAHYNKSLVQGVLTVKRAWSCRFLLGVFRGRASARSCWFPVSSIILSLSNPTNVHCQANIFNKYWALAWVWSLVALLRVLLFAVSQDHLSPHRPCPWHTHSSSISNAKVPYCSSSSLCVSVHPSLAPAILAMVRASWVDGGGPLAACSRFDHPLAPVCTRTFSVCWLVSLPSNSCIELIHN